MPKILTEMPGSKPPATTPPSTATAKVGTKIVPVKARVVIPPSSPKPVEQPSEPVPPPPAKGSKAKKPDNSPLAMGRPVKYPEYKAVARTGDKAVTVEEMIRILGWETEKQYKERMLKLGKKVEAELGFGDEYTCIDANGEKARCWNNADHTTKPPTTWNRRYRDKQGKGIAQDILNSGPLIPEEERAWQFNGEAMVIGRTGLCLSVQHRGIGLLLAWQILNDPIKGPYWREVSWPPGTEPTMETVISYGIKETRAVVRTFDNTAARSTSDTIETSGLFDGVSRTDRLVAAKATDNALKLLWARVDWEGLPTYVSSKTHREEIRFLDLHPKITECVRFAMDINSKEKDRPLATLGLLNGECAGLVYLMGSSDSDMDGYTHAVPIPNESVLCWDNWDRACQFWNKLCDDKDKTFQGLRDALTALRHPTTGVRGKPLDIHSTLAKAWMLFMNGESLTQEAVLPEYKPNATTGKPTMVDGPHVFGGIDRGPGEEEEVSEEKTAEQIEAEKATREAIRRQNLEKGRKKLLEARQKAKNDPAQALPELRTRKQILADQTRRAREADAAAVKEAAVQEGAGDDGEIVEEEEIIEG